MAHYESSNIFGVLVNLENRSWVILHPMLLDLTDLLSLLGNTGDLHIYVDKNVEKQLLKLLTVCLLPL
jgi:hypothetical protein